MGAPHVIKFSGVGGHEQVRDAQPLQAKKQSFAGVVKCPHRTGKGEALEWQGAKSELIAP